MRFFNTAGPVRLDKHYAIEPLSRIDLAGIEMMIAQEKYFVLHAPRQTGKTSTLLALAKRLNESGTYRCVYAHVESAQTTREIRSLPSASHSGSGRKHRRNLSSCSSTRLTLCRATCC